MTLPVPAGQLSVADFRKRRFILVPNDHEGRLSVELVRQTGERWETIWGMGCDDRYQRDTVFDLLWTQSDHWADWGDVVDMSGATGLDAHLRPIVETALRIHMWPRDRWTHGKQRFQMWYTPEHKQDFAPGVLDALDGPAVPSIFIAPRVGHHDAMGPAIHLMRTESHETAMKLQTFFLSDEGACQVDELGDVFVSMGGDAFAVALRHRITVITGRFDAKPVCTPKAWYDPRSKRLEPIPPLALGMVRGPTRRPGLMSSFDMIDMAELPTDRPYVFIRNLRRSKRAIQLLRLGANGVFTSIWWETYDGVNAQAAMFYWLCSRVDDWPIWGALAANGGPEKLSLQLISQWRRDQYGTAALE